MRVPYLIYEDNDDFREALRENLTANEDIELRLAVSNANRVLEDISMYQPKVILMDIEMPGISGIDAVTKLKSRFPEVEVLMLTIFEDNDNVFQAICAGASGYLLKNTPPKQIVEAIVDAAQGGAPMTSSIARKILSFIPKVVPRTNRREQLTERETQILNYLVNGYPHKFIANELHVTINAVRFHLKNIYLKLQVHSAPEAVGRALREKLVG